MANPNNDTRSYLAPRAMVEDSPKAQPSLAVARKFQDIERILLILEDAKALAEAAGEGYLAEPIRLAIARAEHALELAGGASKS